MRSVILAAVALMALCALPAAAQGGGGVDGYAFWLPSGELKVGEAPNDSVNPTQKYFDYKSTDASETFTLHPKSCRWGAPWGQFVIIRLGATTTPEFTVDGQPAGKLGFVTFVPVKMSMTKDDKGNPVGGKDPTKIEVKAPPVKGSTYLIYWTDDAMHLGLTVEGAMEGAGGASLGSYSKGIVAFWKGDYKKSQSEFLKGEKTAKTPAAQREYRRLARWAAAYTRFSQVKTGPGFYELGQYCMVNGFWDLAADSYRKATELMPKDPDAAFMLANSLSYKWGDQDMKEEAVFPYYKKAADLYPREGSNTFRTHFGLFKNLILGTDDKGNPVVTNMTDDQIAYVKKTWEWCSVIMEGVSKGKLRMVNTYDVQDKVFDSRDVWSAKPFYGLFRDGTVDTFIKMTGWGASDACGMDCGPDRSAYINLGIREWEVSIHEWNHTLDWSMISGELGLGVPETHSSDWCGFEPISCMGMGHQSCNRYYMTPGMYEYMRGCDPVTTAFITDWLVTAAPVVLAQPKTAEEIKAGGKPMDDFYTTVYGDARKATPPASSEFTVKPKLTELASDEIMQGKVENGYVDFQATYGAAAVKNGYAFAESYVYSPAKQKVRVWLGSDDNIRVWLNGRLVKKGVYWTCALWTERKEPDQTAGALMLEKGWNRLTVQITNRQHGPDWLGGDPPDQWGFTVRICDAQNGEVSGLKYQAERPAGYKDTPAFVVDPKNPKTYKWSEVKDDYTFLIPELSIEDLRAITGYKTLTATNEMFWDLSKETLDPSVKQYVLDKADPKNVGLNNELNWYFSPREMCAFIRYNRGGQTRDLLFIKNEARDAYATLMPVSKGAKKLGIQSNDAQVIGYFLLEYPGCPNGRGVIVLDTYLGDKAPADEEDLMSTTGLK